MTKPWEETWDVEPEIAPGWVLVKPIVALGPAPLQPLTGDRLRLAAAAPDLVRALLAVERQGVNLDGDAACPACGGDARDSTDPPTHSVMHASDCLLDAALRKAGVR